MAVVGGEILRLAVGADVDDTDADVVVVVMPTPPPPPPPFCARMPSNHVCQ